MRDKVSEYISPSAVRAAADFSVHLLQSTYEPSGNTLISPTSLLAVLSMAQLGAQELTQMEMDMAIGADTEEVIALLDSMLSSEEGQGPFRGPTVKCANAVWLRNDGSVKFNERFLDACKEVSHAEVIQAPFDEDTVDTINQWVREKTDGEIDSMLGELPEDLLMFLLNALCFDGQWETVFESSDVAQRSFTTEDGEEQKAYFMQSTEDLYLIDDEARGFLKEYRGGRYAFAALLPDRGVSLREYISQLDGERLLSILRAPIHRKVEIRLPRFEVEQDVGLKAPLMEMGICEAFDWERADFSGIGKAADPNHNLYIDNVWQKNKIRVNEDGTKAVSVTGIDTLCLSSLDRQPIYRVYLNRPFLYMVIDRETNLPLFMGTITSLQNES